MSMLDDVEVRVEGKRFGFDEELDDRSEVDRFEVEVDGELLRSIDDDEWLR